MLEFTGDAVYESEENEIMKTRQQRRSTLRPTCKRFAVYISSLGNYFFAELTNLLAIGLEKLGFEVDLRDENMRFDEDADWHIIAALPEFFS